MRQIELNIQDYWRIILKRKVTLIVTALGVTVAVAVLSPMMAPAPQFEATTRVKFDRNNTFEELFAQAVSFSYSDEIGSQVEVVRSFPVLEAVANQLNFLPAEESGEQPHSEKYLGIVYSLRNAILPQQEGSTNVITISATAREASLSAKMANAVAQAYREFNIKSQNRMVTESRQFIESQLRALESKLSVAESHLRNFQEQEGQVLMTDEARNNLTAFTKLEGDLGQIRRSRQEAIDQLKTLENNQLLFSAEDEFERIYTDDFTQILYKLNLRLADQLQERGTLLLNFTPKHPQVKVLDWKIKNIKTEMIRELTTKVETLQNRERALAFDIQQYRDQYSQYPEKGIVLARLEREVAVNSDLYTQLRTKHQEMLIKSAQQIQEVTILEPAIIPLGPSNTANTHMKMIVGAAMGLFLGILAAFMQESVDASIGPPQEVEKLLLAPVLGMVPELKKQELNDMALQTLGAEWTKEKGEIFSRLFCLMDPQSKLSENLRAIRSNIQFACVGREVKTILVTNVGLVKGRIGTRAGSATLVNLALLLAEEGKRVLLVDANLRRPIIHKRLGLPLVPGLTDALIGGLNWKEQIRTTTDLMMGPLGLERVMNTPELDLFDVFPGGTISPNPSKLLHSVKLGELILEMREHYDFVLLDAPPMLPVADSIVLSSKVDGVVLLCQEGQTKRGALQRTKMLLNRARATLIGVILTNTPPDVMTDYTSGQYVGQPSYQA